MAYKRILQRVLAIAGARMHHQARWLVDHYHRRVLVDYVQRQVLGCDARLVRQAGFHRGGFAARHQVTGARRQPVDPRCTLLDPALDPGA